jgi:hypothetical protein
LRGHKASPGAPCHAPVAGDPRKQVNKSKYRVISALIGRDYLRSPIECLQSLGQQVLTLQMCPF